MTDVRNLKTCVFKTQVSHLFERDTPFFVFEIDSRLDNLVGTVLSEGRYIQINEKTFEFLGNVSVCGSSKRGVQPYQIMKRALANDPHLIATAPKSVFYNSPFNLRVPTVPEDCRSIPVWHSKSPDVSLLNVKAFEKVVNHYEKKVIAFGTSLK